MPNFMADPEAIRDVDTKKKNKKLQNRNREKIQYGLKMTKYLIIIIWKREIRTSKRRGKGKRWKKQTHCYLQGSTNCTNVVEHACNVHTEVFACTKLCAHNSIKTL